ncbi:MAG: Glutathione-regulated potassium-efflux system protein KefC [Syntrophorhabdus sp. PtaB.Bin047]|nr:MAG: Glutathione-regulated potassium-efflux system protein KefC [Syntrophorhabdus sp. PtaB.Bin047]
MRLACRVAVLSASFVLFSKPLLASGDGGSGLVTSVGIAIIAATVMSFLGHMMRQPLLLAYIAAGVLIGPNIGLGLVTDASDIETISHIGLILLLFLIGLEIDIKKLKESGRSLVVTGLFQFILCVLLGLGFFYLLGFTVGGGRYDLVYLAACCALSSTAIVVKLLYGKFEIDTLAGRITLGVLVFQDIWAIILLGIQPNLANPEILMILFSFLKGGVLVVFAFLLSRYLLPRLFRKVSKTPELVLVASLGWCFFICGLAGYLGLSLEMGALIAGISISTFPYNLDVMARVINIRDFFVTLFFVALGMQIPNPMGSPGVLATAGIASAFLIVSRFLAVYPVLYSLRNGNRVSLLTSINLSQISEFSLVITALGMRAGHIGQDVMSLVIFVFVITSVVSTYMINYSDALQRALGFVLGRVGFRDIGFHEEEEREEAGREIMILGFHRNASSLISEIVEADGGVLSEDMKDRIMVVDFNPEVHTSLQSLGIKVVYGDVGHLDTLHHAGLEKAKLVISTVPDSILVGTDNLTFIRHIRRMNPGARIIVTAESVQRALKMYTEGADYVFMPRILTARHLVTMMGEILSADPARLKAIARDETEALARRHEIVG